MTSKECGAFIAMLRKENELTQKELAEKINVSDKAVSRWETSKSYPDVTSLMSLSEYFEISVNELLAGKRLSVENIKETADKNIISVFEEAQKNKKKQIFQTALYTVMLLVIGCFIRKGNLSILHSYHYKNVADLKGYAKEMGNGIIFMSIPIFLDGFLTLFAHIKNISIISSVLLFAGIIICIIYIFKVQTKYNGSLF